MQGPKRLIKNWPNVKRRWLFSLSQTQELRNKSNIWKLHIRKKNNPCSTNTVITKLWNILLEDIMEAESTNELKRLNKNLVQNSISFYNSQWPIFLQPCSQENLNHVLPAAKKLPGGKNPVYVYPIFHILFLIVHYWPLAGTIRYIHSYEPDIFHNSNCIQDARFSVTLQNSRYTNNTWKLKKPKQQKPNQTKKASHVFHVMVHLFYSFHVLATWCRYLYWKHNLKYKTYQ